MKKHVIILFTFLAFVLVPSTSYAQGGCGGGARKLASQEKATIIAVQPKKGASGKVVCEVRLQKKSKNGQPPRIIIKKFSPK